MLDTNFQLLFFISGLLHEILQTSTMCNGMTNDDNFLLPNLQQTDSWHKYRQTSMRRQSHKIKNNVHLLVHTIGYLAKWKTIMIDAVSN